MKRTDAVARTVLRPLFDAACFVFALAFSLACNPHNTLQPLAVRGSAALVGTVTTQAPDGSHATAAGVSIGITQCIPGTGEVGPYWSQCDWDNTGSAVSAADGTYSIATLYAGSGTLHASGAGFLDYSASVSLPAGSTRFDIEMQRAR